MAYLAPELLEGNGPVNEHDETPDPDFVPKLSKETDVYGFSMVALEVSDIHNDMQPTIAAKIRLL